MITRGAAGLTTAALVAACDAGGAREDRLALMVSMVCANGGAMTTAEAATLLPAEGFSMDEAQAIVAELENRGQVVPMQGIDTLQLTADACN